jgi:Spy/CpxP family protein refolding chaperone
MNKAKRILAAIALAMALGAVSASAAAAQGPECPPDQHGNLGPGFKPAPCPPN